MIVLCNVVKWRVHRRNKRHRIMQNAKRTMSNKYAQAVDSYAAQGRKHCTTQQHVRRRECIS